MKCAQLKPTYDIKNNIYKGCSQKGTEIFLFFDCSMLFEFLENKYIYVITDEVIYQTTINNIPINNTVKDFILSNSELMNEFRSPILLFGCKLAQSNILPTEGVTKEKPYVKPVDINIFPTTIGIGNEKMSKKIQFPYDSYNSSNELFDIIRENQESSSSFLLQYFFFQTYLELKLIQLIKVF